MDAAARGNRAAVESLYDRHHRRLYTFVCRWTGDHAAAEDVVHDVFLRLLSPSVRYEPGRAFEPWLFRIARNLVIDWFRRRSRLAELAEADEHAAADDPENNVDNVEDLERLEHSLAQLRPADREVILMRAMLDLDYDGIGRALHCTPGAARVRLHRALAALRAQWAAIAGGTR
jgi:RNA polymerase sigma-70 factor (ECF subfamily)